MTNFFCVIASILLIIGIPMALDITPERMVDELMETLRPKTKLRFQVEDVQNHKQRTSLYGMLTNMKAALEATGRGVMFPLIFCAAVSLFVVGILIAFAIDNPFLAPSFAIGLAMIPFGYISSTVTLYNRNTKEELETALSIITNAYLRTDNIIQAVQENVNYIKPPLRNVFQSFLGDATVISSNPKKALYILREKVNDQVFYEWVTTLIQCQDDRTMKDNLLPIVAKLTDIRLVNNQLKNMMISLRMEYMTMVALVIGNIPLLYVLNIDWFNTLVHTVLGKFILGCCGIAIVITAFLLARYTRPIEYKK